RVAARGRELSIRTALGAGRLRLIRQLLTESVLLALLGGALGLLLAHWGTRALVALNPAAIPRPETIRLDGRVLAFTLGLSLLSGLLFGLFPALHDPAQQLHESLKEGGRAVAGGRRGRFARHVLALTEVAVALVLLIMAGILLRSFARLSTVDPGFRPAGVLTLEVAVPEFKYTDSKRLEIFYRGMLERVGTLPGVAQAALLFPMPLSGRGVILSFDVAGRPAPPPNQMMNANIRWGSPEVFATLGIPLRNGRVFDVHDTASEPGVAVINQTMAAKVWPHEDPLGKRFTFDDRSDPKARWLTVIGVVGDVKQQALSEAPASDIYLSQLQDPQHAASLLVRSTGDLKTLVTPIRKAILGLDPDLPVYKARTADELVSDSLSQSRLSTALLGLFAALALVLAAVGVYGVLSYSVAQRTHELGIRMALGAHRGDVLRLVLAQGMRLVAIGLGVGLIGAFFATRTLAGLVYGVGTKDPVTFVGVPLILAAVAFAANYVPARRATRVDPQVALREE
ncbi:MAG TPA: ADOP family duplicated permease, partial [Thermoanaerobaculia bacterium]|nr:ADOP family duplicated permease [Thermoanaerobaculia bacterium]